MPSLFNFIINYIMLYIKNQMGISRQTVLIFLYFSRKEVRKFEQS
ncbi:hypothetical protein VSDKYIMU_CDS0128 [Enterococcus phage VRE9_4]